MAREPPCSCDALSCGAVAFPLCVSPWQGKSLLTTNICLKILLSNLADGQSRVLQGVIKLNSFEHVPRQTSRMIQLCRSLVCGGNICVFLLGSVLCVQMLLLQTLLCELFSGSPYH